MRTEVSLTEGGGGLANDEPGIGSWITEEEEMQGLTPSPTSVDVTFILAREDPAVMDDFRAAAIAHKNRAVTPYQSWAFFFREGFLGRFDQVRGQPGTWHRGNANVYRRHSWNQRNGLPDNWEAALNGYWRLGLRWWRRNLLQTYRSWIAVGVPPDILRHVHGLSTRFGRKKADDSLKFW